MPKASLATKDAMSGFDSVMADIRDFLQEGAKTRKNPAAVALGRKGGLKTRKNLTAKQRSESTRRAALARWSKEKKQR